jgi:hypothetical protein
MYEQIIEIISDHDFPDKWTQLMPNIIKKLQSTQQLDEYYSALLVLKSVVKKYEFLFGQERSPLLQIV